MTSLRLRRAIAVACIAALAAGHLPAAQAQRAAGAVGAQAIPASMTRDEYEACQTRDIQGFRGAIEAVTLKSLKAGAAGADYLKIVGDEWRRGNFDDILDRQVDRAIEEVRQETSFADLMKSLADKDTAAGIATAVAERAYRSDAIKKAIEELATGVGREVGKRLELATSDAAEPAMQCMQAFLGPRYGSVVARVVAGNAGREFGIDPEKAGAQVTTGQILLDSKEGIAGAMVLLVRRQLARMASRVGQRIAGAVLSRLVSVASGGVGIALIAKDIWDLRNGVLPIIADEMKSKESKDKVRQELATAIAEQINDNLREIAGKTADRVLEVWQEFRSAHARVLELAEKHEAFKRFLDGVAPDKLGRVDEITGLVLAGEGEAGVLARLGDGTLHEAVSRLGPAALEIARDTRSLATAMAWTTLAGAELPKVVGFELHRFVKPEQISKPGLTRLLALDDKAAIGNLVAMQPALREPLLALEARELKGLARGLATAELETLSRYVTGLAPPASARILRAVAAEPARMQPLAPTRVRDAILASRDQDAAVAMILRAGELPNPVDVLADFRSAWDGRVSPVLLWDRHPIAIATLGGVALLLLLAFWRALFGRRPRVAAAAAESAVERGGTKGIGG